MNWTELWKLWHAWHFSARKARRILGLHQLWSACLYRYTSKPRFTDTRFIRTPYYCRQFAYPWGKKALTLSLNSTPLIRTLYMPPQLPPPLPPSTSVRINGVWLSLVQGTQRQFLENICSEEDLRSRICVVKFLACLPLLGFSNI